MPNLLPPCPNCNNRATFSCQQKEGNSKGTNPHSAMLFNINGEPVERRRVSCLKHKYPHYTYCAYCTKRRKNVYYSKINNQIQKFDFPKKPFLLAHYEMYDLYHTYKYRDDRLEIAKSFGYQYISEATVKMYKKLKSIYHTGRVLKVTDSSIRSELKMMGIKRNGHGGWWNKGTNMGGKGIRTKKQYLKLINERLEA